MEKITIFSHIQSNELALEAVLLDADKKGAEKLLNLGDIFYKTFWLDLFPNCAYN
jgi:hypothetical protein